MANLIGAAKPDSASTDASDGIWINLTANDSTSYGPLTVIGVSGALGNPSLNPDATGGVWYSPGSAFDYLSVGEKATDTFKYTVADALGDTSTSTVTVTVTGVNLPPVAQPDSAATDAQHGVWLNLTGNDSDPNRDDTISVTALNLSGTNGTATLNASAPNGAWYSPGTAFDYLSAGETATDQFSYTITDNHGATATATATVTVTGVNLPPVTSPEQVSTDAQDGMWINLLATASDPNRHDVLTVSGLNLAGTIGDPTFVPGSTNGVYYSPGTAFDYLSAGETATDTFGYTVSDGHGGMASSTVTVTVTGVNLPPVANPDAAATDAQHEVWVNLTRNDTDPNRDDTLSVTALDLGGTRGTATLDPKWPSGVRYSPGAAFDYLSVGETATDSFGYTVSDGHGGTATSTATVTVTGVNLPPVAKPEIAATDAQDGVWINLLAGASDPNFDDVLTVSALDLSGTKGDPAFASGSRTGVWYSPGSAFDYLSVGETATDTFGYTISDGHGGTVSSTATVTVTGVNLPPVANPDTAATDAQHGVWIDLAANDTDPNLDDKISVTAVSDAGTHGTAVLNPTASNGAWYSPGAAFDYLSVGQTATDHFGYTISDGHGGTDTSTATVTITGVNLPPVTTPVVATTDAYHPIWLGLLSHDSDPNLADTLSITAVNLDSAKGSVSFIPGQSGVFYTPGTAFQGLGAGQSATDSFSYTVADNHGATATGTATVTVDAPGALTGAGLAFYVAPNGDDDWSGRLAQPNAAGTDGPFATLNAARLAMENSLPTQTTYVEGGDYYLAAPLDLTTADSGQTWSAYNGQTVNIHGGPQVTGWTSQGGAMWAAQPSAGTVQDGAINPLYISGAAQTDARFPAIVPGVAGSGWLTATASLPGDDASTQFQFAGGSIPTFANPTGLYAAVFTQNGWAEAVSPVASIDYAADQITLASPAPYAIGAGSRFYLFNAAGQVNTPGEYYYDPGSNKLTYDAAPGFAGSGASIGTLQHVIGLYGAHNVTLNGLTIGDAASNGYGIQISGSSNVTVSNGTIDNAGAGVVVGSDSSNVHITGNQLHNLNDYGILITPGSNAVTASGNDIHDVGAASSGSGIWFTGSSNDVFSGNTLANIAKVGIGGGSLAGLSDASYNDTITGNTITNANTQSADAGGIYLIGRQQNAMNDTISYNTVAGTTSSAAGSGIGAGIYLDDFASGVTIHGNLLQNNLEGVWVHLGSNNTISNNVITGSSFAALIMDGNNGTGVTAVQPPTGNLFQDNTAYLSQSASLADMIFRASKAAGWSGNIYGGPATGAQPFSIDTAGSTARQSFAQWVALGNDTASPAPSTGLTLSQALANLPAPH